MCKVLTKKQELKPLKLSMNKVVDKTSNRNQNSKIKTLQQESVMIDKVAIQEPSVL